MPAKPNYWLLKTEPSSFSITDLQKAPQQTTIWDGVRNYQARNFLRDEIQVGDIALIYHSQTPPLAIVGEAVVIRAGYPDASQFDPKDSHYDPDSAPMQPRWFAIDIRLRRVFPQPLTRAQLKTEPRLADMELLRLGSRLSVQPVGSRHYDIICDWVTQGRWVNR